MIGNIIDLRRIAYDPAVPLSTRQAALKKYELELDAGVKEFAKHMESLRRKYINEEKSFQ